MGCSTCGKKSTGSQIKVGTPQPKPAKVVGKSIPAKLVKIQWGK